MAGARALHCDPRHRDQLLLGVSLVAALVVSARFVDYAYDDAYITYRYARNLIHGEGFVYNVGQHHLGTTTPLYTLLLAGLGLLAPIPLASGCLSVASVVAGIALVEVIGRSAGVRCAGSAAALFLIANPSLYQIFGGETLFLHFLLLPFGYSLHRRGDEIAAAVVFALAILTRMDAALFAVILYGEWAMRRRRLPWAHALAIAATLAPWLGYATWSFGQPLPATLGVKMAMGASGQWPLFFEGSRRHLSELPEYAAGLRGPFLALLALGLARSVLVERVWLPFVVYTGLSALIYQLVLGAAFSHWYLAHVYLTNALLLGAGLRQLLAWVQGLARRTAPRRAALAAAGALSLLLVAGMGAYLARATQALARLEVDPRHQLYRRIGEWLRDHTPPDATVHYFEIGYVGWYSERTIIDRVGLVTPGGEEAVRSGDVTWALRRYRPDYYILNTRFGIPRHVSDPAFWRRHALVATITQPGYVGEAMILARHAPSGSRKRRSLRRADPPPYPRAEPRAARRSRAKNQPQAAEPQAG